MWRAKVEGRTAKAKSIFLPFSKPSPFSSMTETASSSPINDESLPQRQLIKMKAMSENNMLTQRIREEFARFEKTMEELYLLKRVAADLKSYRKMIRLKKYD